MTAYLATLWGILVETSPFAVLGVVAAGFVHEALGRFQHLRRFARKRSVWTLSFFNLAGFTLPVCSCGTVPLAVGLRKQGVPYGNVFSFIFSAPATSVAAVILSLAMLGKSFTAYYVAGAVICGYLVGLVFYLFEPSPSQDLAQDPVLLCADASRGVPNSGFLVRALRWGTVTYGSRIAFDLIVGLALAAWLVSSYSVQSLGDWLGGFPYWQASLMMIAVAIPLYVCSLPGIMVGATLILGGVAPELVWVFLMAGPVTNLGDINVLRDHLGWRSTFLYVATVVGVTLLWGLLIRYQVDPMDMWSHAREYFAEQSAVVDSGGALGNIVAESFWLGIPRPLYDVSAVLLVLLTLNGARLTLKEFWRNPCLHCKHFQRDMSLSAAICPLPCWKKRVLLALKAHVVPRLKLVASRAKSVS